MAGPFCFLPQKAVEYAEAHRGVIVRLYRYRRSRAMGKRRTDKGTHVARRVHGVANWRSHAGSHQRNRGSMRCLALAKYTHLIWVFGTSSVTFNTVNYLAQILQQFLVSATGMSKARIFEPGTESQMELPGTLIDRLAELEDHCSNISRSL